MYIQVYIQFLAIGVSGQAQKELVHIYSQYIKKKTKKKKQQINKQWCAHQPLPMNHYTMAIQPIH